MIRESSDNIIFLDRLIKYFPARPTNKEIENDQREIAIYKKKNGIPLTTAMKITEV